MLTLCSWNVNGWNASNHIIRELLLKHFDHDVIFICESHLKLKESISLSNYKWYGQNRQLQHKKNYRRGMGGVGFLIKSYLYSEYNIKCVDSSHEGVLVFSFQHKVSQMSLIIVGCYLPPENSVYGKNTELYFNYIGSLLLQYDDCDLLLICGDLNARISNIDDIERNLDAIDLQKRLSCDTVLNSHGKVFLHFLQDNELCVLNGRFANNSNDYTSISTRGKAVVDYMIVNQNQFKFITDFKIILMIDLMDKVKHAISDKCRLPDHSMLHVKLQLTYTHESPTLSITDRCHNNNEIVCTNVNNNPHALQLVNYNFRIIPDDFMNDSNWDETLDKLYRTIELFNEHNIRQTMVYEDTHFIRSIDNIYDMFLSIINQEISLKLKVKGSKIRKKGYGNQSLYKCKPYWNDMLEMLWKSMKEAERSFLKYTGNRLHLKHLREQFKHRQWDFDKHLSYCKRSFAIMQQNELIQDRCSNPTRFWGTVRNLIPVKKTMIPLKVFHNNVFTDDLNVVLEKWKSDYELLYNQCDLQDLQFLQYVTQQIEHYDTCLYHGMGLPQNEYLNEPIAMYEIENAISRLKLNKASGIDMIPNEILKQKSMIKSLHLFISTCFENRTTPSIWNKSIIAPIPKDKTKCQYTPLNYRGISLTCTISKLYSRILCKRITDYCDILDFLVDEQNGFRQNRSCADQIYALSTIVRHCINVKTSTYCAFIDFQKAFDCVNRDMLMFRLLSYNIDGKMFSAIRNLYHETQSCIKLNDKYTDMFNVTCGVKQGDNLSPTLFSLFINDLAIKIKELKYGVKIANEIVSILLYADDIVLLSNSENNLQKMLLYMNTWCEQWCLKINVTKSKVVHFRPKSIDQSSFIFMCGTQIINIVKNYKYLGIILDEHLDFDECITTLSSSASRALSAIINKYNVYKNFSFNIYLQLYNTNVLPVILYGAECWGSKKLKKYRDIQYRAMRFFLGVHNTTSLAAMRGDMGWVDVGIKKSICMIRFWNRLINMENSRLTKRIFLWDYNTGHNNWCIDLKNIFSVIDCMYVYDRKLPCDMKFAETKLIQNDIEVWHHEISVKPKLRTYTQFKTQYMTEPYISKPISRHRRSLLSQFRMGILPLEIETGRFYPIYDKVLKKNRIRESHERICRICKSGDIENELHFLCICPLYQNVRNDLYAKMIDYNPEFINLSTVEKFVYMLTQHQLEVSSYIVMAWKIRQEIL